MTVWGVLPMSWPARSRKPRPSLTTDALARMKTFTILRDYRRAAHTMTDTTSGIAHLHNIILAG